jgi:hypothetical protein
MEGAVRRDCGGLLLQLLAGGLLGYGLTLRGRQPRLLLLKLVTEVLCPGGPDERPGQ